MSTTPFPILTLGPETGFASGTRVHTKEGLKPIESIRVGDWVLTHLDASLPPHRRRQRDEYLYRQVTHITAADVQSLVSIVLQNMADGIEDTVLAATGQPFWTQPEGWRAASHVRPMQALVLSFNGNALVHSVSASDQPARVYHLDVEDCSSYYVEQLGAWVCCKPDAALPPTPVAQSPKSFDLSKPQVLLEIKDYYNDHLADPGPEPAKTTTRGLAEQMLAAAERLRKVVREQRKQELEYDEASVRWLDGYIESARQRNADPHWKQNLIHLIGAFLGECIIRSLGGQWTMHEDMVCVKFSDGNAAFPHNKVTKQFDNGREAGDSILGFYQGNMGLFKTLASNPLTPAQERLLEYSRDSKYRIFVRYKPGTKTEWALVAQVQDGKVTLHKPPGQAYTTSLFLNQLQCFYVCSPMLKLLHSEWINKSDWDSLPPNILKQLKSNLSAETSLTLDQLEHGKRFIEVSYGASDKQANDDRHYYSTNLKNTSAHKIRITKFGGFKAAETAWQLASVTGDFYTADDFRDWYGQKTEWLQPGETVCDATNWGYPPVLWAYYGVTDSGESFISGAMLEKPVASPGSSSGAHFVKSAPPQPEFEQIVNKLRASFELRQQRMSSISIESLIGPRPSWLKETDGLWEFFTHQKLLLTEGQIVWGGLVQANSLLFEPGDANCPALLVYSPDSYFDSRPQELRLIGRTFFSFKHTDPTDPELKEVARLVSDEMDRSMGFELPKVFSSKPLRSATFIVFRKHIPNGVLSGGMFPILTHPTTQAVMMVPFEFWPIELIVLWKEGKI